MIDLNNVTGGGGSDFELIPEGTIARAIIKIQPNPVIIPELSNSPMFAESQSSSAKWMDVEYTIFGGAFDRRKFWHKHFFDGDSKDTDGVSKAKKISLGWLKAVLESHRDIASNDASPTAQAVRQLDASTGGVAAINGMSVCVKVGIKKEPDPKYNDSNVVRAILTLGMDGYIPNTPNSSPPVGGSTPPVNNDGGNATVPDWAKG